MQSQQSHIPKWILVLIGAMFRFVTGGFGVSLPHPYKAQFCLHWPLAVLGCTVLLSVVLLGWTIRLTLGKGRAERFFDWLGDISNTPQAKILGEVFLWIIITAVVGALLSCLGYAIYKYGALVVSLYALLVVGGVTALISVLVLIAAVSDKLRAWNASRPKPEKHVEDKEEKPSQIVAVSKKSFAVLKTIFIVVTWLPKIVLLGAWQVLEFFGGRIYDFYKKRCPVVEFP